MYKIGDRVGVILRDKNEFGVVVSTDDSSVSVAIGENRIVQVREQDLWYEKGGKVKEMTIEEKGKWAREEKMDRKTVLENLCSYDPKNPDNMVLDSDKKPRQIDCYCDNCFYGRDKLAMALLEFMEEKD